ncbi:MAG: WYL domain-containing protein [Bacteroidales bacterium]|nr:WYL domain-containing protein [Bacteroidales bacterium]
MPVNRNAILRYKTIDHCLCNRYRKWTLKDLIEACSDALYEYEGIRKGISRRTIQLDIQNMRSDRLGYNAPIIVVDNKYYTYEDPDYSIIHSPLTERDMTELVEAVGVLKQMTVFPAMSGVSDLVSRMEEQVSMATGKREPLILMERNDRLKGLEYVPILYEALKNRCTQEMVYQSFKAKGPSTFLFYPYVLKEFNNRWFVLGQKEKSRMMNIFALDRIQSLRSCPDVPYYKSADFDAEKYFAEMVGVSRNENEKPQIVKFWASKMDSPYFITKPIHHTQEIILQKETGETLFSINVIINRELMRELLGFGAGVKVIEPKPLAAYIRKRHQDAADGILSAS